MPGTVSDDQQAGGAAGGGEAGRLVEGWRREQADRWGTVEAGAPVADQLERLATRAGGWPLRRLVTGWRYTRAGRIRHVVVAEELEGWDVVPHTGYYQRPGIRSLEYLCAGQVAPGEADELLILRRSPFPVR